MIKAEEIIQIHLEPANEVMKVRYTPLTDRTIYDICDLNGRIVQTGSIEGDKTEISIKGLGNSCYILLILDGDRVTSRKFGIKC